MQKAYKTINNEIINEEHISMFQLTNENGQHQIKLIVDFDHDEEYVLFSGNEVERDENIKKIKDILSCNDWGELIDGSLFRIHHIKYSKIYEHDGMYCLDVCFTGKQTISIFQGTKEGLDVALKEFKILCYAVIYNLEDL